MKELFKLSAEDAQKYGHNVVETWARHNAPSEGAYFFQARLEGARWGGVWSIVLLCNQIRQFDGAEHKAFAPNIVLSVSSDNAWKSILVLPAAIVANGFGLLDMNPYASPLRSICRAPMRQMRDSLKMLKMVELLREGDIIVVGDWLHSLAYEGSR